MSPLRGNSLPEDSELDGLLAAVARDLGLGLTSTQFHQLRIHFSLLLRWNRKVNLTAIRQPREIAIRHFEESLVLATVLPPPQGILVDVGSGAGFPGLPLKIAWPQVETILLEPNHKKATFLKEVVRRCGLTGVEVRAERLESVVRGKLAGRVALVTMRAVAPSPETVQALKALLCPGGRVALYVGEDAAAALRATAGFEWEKSAAVPHALRRVVMIGRPSGKAGCPAAGD